MKMPSDKAPALSAEGSEQRTLLDLAALALLAGLLFTVSLGARDLWNPNEPIYGRAVAEMAERGDWLVPTINGLVFAEKPILYYWGALAASATFGGVNELSLRLPSALAAVASVVLTYLWVLPYVGRRRALVSAALCGTLFQVFWVARSVQMDVLVLASTIGVLLPLSRMLDFEANAARSWALAGFAAGLGFAAKGPVALVLPGLVILAYALATRRLFHLVRREMWIGAATALLAGAPWFVILWLRGETGILHEMLIRQNFHRFVEAWDHQRPWWYYFTYLWTDYAPWSWLLPAAWLMGRDLDPERDRAERRLHLLSWIWIAAVVLFFSFSSSKRAPYIVPIAPAVAALAGGVVVRLLSGVSLAKKARVASTTAFSILGALFLLAGTAALVLGSRHPELATMPVQATGVLLLLAGAALVVATLRRRSMPAAAPITLFSAITALYLMLAIWVLPSLNPLKSARAFSTELNQRLAATQGEIVSFRFWNWRSGYAYYANRSIRNVREDDDLLAFWRDHESPYVLVEGAHEGDFKALVPDAQLVQQAEIGSREAFLYAREGHLGTVPKVTGGGVSGPP